MQDGPGRSPALASWAATSVFESLWISLSLLTDGSHRSPSCSQQKDAAARTRTWDNHVNSVVLYHLSYGGPLLHSQVVGVI